MPRPQNPYIAGNPVGNSPAFVGRDDVLRAVLDVLSAAQHHGIVLFGQRRIGKTSILQHLAEWLPTSGGPRAVYFDLQEYAARGGTAQRKYPWGDAPPPGSQLCWSGEGSNLGKEKRTMTCPVRKYPDGDAKWETSRLHDMAGNVWEWTSSYYCPYDKNKNCDRVKYALRGGCWLSEYASTMRAMKRDGYAPEDASIYIGFRCARAPL